MEVIKKQPVEPAKDEAKSPEVKSESIDLNEKMELDLSSDAKPEPEPEIKSWRRPSEEDKPRRTVIDTTQYEPPYYYKRARPEPAVYKPKAQQTQEANLTKDDLQPFFESQQRSQEKKETSTSIFTYNPLNL